MTQHTFSTLDGKPRGYGGLSYAVRVDEADAAVEQLLAKGASHAE